MRNIAFRFTTRVADAIWYRSSCLWIFLFPLELIYRAVVLVKRKEKVSRSFRVPIIVVGNLTVGGTGKSPLVIAVAQALKAEGYVPGIISRGYAGKRIFPAHPLCVMPESSPEMVGDEPVMIARATKMPMVVGIDRVCAVQFLLEQFPNCNVILSDDGLQHYRLQRDVSICIVDSKRKFGNRHCLPAGPLREPLSRLNTFDFVIENDKTHSPEVTLEDAYFENVFDENNKKEMTFFSGKKVHAVAAIGNPARFFDRLKRLNIDSILHVFPDHHPYSREEIIFNDDLPVIMTEKDAVKCSSFLGLNNVWFLKVNMTLSDDFKMRLLKKLEGKKAR